MTRTLMFAAILPHGFLTISQINEQPETSLGVFDNSVLDLYDDTLAAIYRISKGISFNLTE